MENRKTANYKIIPCDSGSRYRFYCDISGVLACVTKEVYKGDDPEEALLLAWKREGHENFNQCHRCGKWVIDAVYNAEVLECVDCAPYEAEPKYCKNCGAKIEDPVKICPSCGKKLIYEGGVQ